MNNEILKWITMHPDMMLIFEAMPYFTNEFTIEMREQKRPERIKYRINSLMAEFITEILDQMREELIGAEIIEKRAACDRDDMVQCENCKYNPDKPHKYYDDDLIYGYIWCPKFIEDLNGKGFCPYGREYEE